MKILIADDHAVVREGLKQILTEIPDTTEIDGVTNGFEVLEKISKKDYDIVILDISMPHKNGLEVLKEIKLKKPSIPVLMLSIYPEGQYATRVLKAGAAGYLTKDSAAEELVTAVEKVLSGGKYITSSLAEKLASDFTENSVKLPHEYLSDREFEIFKMIAAAKSIKEISKELFISDKTVSTYKSRIYEKMKMNSNSEITQYAVLNGLMD